MGRLVIGPGSVDDISIDGTRANPEERYLWWHLTKDKGDWQPGWNRVDEVKYLVPVPNGPTPGFSVPLFVDSSKNRVTISLSKTQGGYHRNLLDEMWPQSDDEDDAKWLMRILRQSVQSRTEVITATMTLDE